jgi:hypothetical protein
MSKSERTEKTGQFTERVVVQDKTTGKVTDAEGYNRDHDKTSERANERSDRKNNDYLR